MRCAAAPGAAVEPVSIKASYQSRSSGCSGGEGCGKAWSLHVLDHTVNEMVEDCVTDTMGWLLGTMGDETN
jgi:hypothetical protein